MPLSCITGMQMPGCSVILLQSHLWCNIVWSAAEGTCGHAFIHILLTHAKVRYLDVSLRVKHYIVELQIPAAETVCESL